MRDIGEANKGDRDPDSESLIKFKVIFAVALEREQRWRGLELEEIENAEVAIDQQCPSQLQHRPKEKAANPQLGPLPVVLIHEAMDTGPGASRRTETVNR